DLLIGGEDRLGLGEVERLLALHELAALLRLLAVLLHQRLTLLDRILLGDRERAAKHEHGRDECQSLHLEISLLVGTVMKPLKHRLFWRATRPTPAPRSYSGKIIFRDGPTADHDSVTNAGAAKCPTGKSPTACAAAAPPGWRSRRAPA